MKQTRLASLLESWGNTIVGFVGSLLIQWAICAIYGLPLQLHDNLAIIGVFTAWSFLRGYLWRRLMESLHVRVPLSAGALAVIAERRRQVDAEGWTAEHDDAHEDHELERAAACYAYSATIMADREAIKRRLDIPHTILGELWPFDRDWFKPAADRRRDLVRAGALLLAAIERHDRRRKARRRGNTMVSP